MADVEIRLPKMGESVTEATITNWLKNIGDNVELDEPLVEVATDKVDNEIPSEVGGKLVKILFDKDQVAQVGDVIAIISTGGDSTTATEAPKQEDTTSPIKVTATDKNVVAPKTTISNSDRFYSPLVKSIASEEGISQTELDALAGTGKDGRVTKKDILSYLENRGSQPVANASSNTAKSQANAATLSISTSNVTTSNVPAFISNMKVPSPMPNADDEIMEMDRMRKIIADNMVMSKHVSPHVTSFVEADVTNIVNWRNKNKKLFEQREGEKLTFTPIFIEAIVRAIKDFPMVNISVTDDNKIIKRKHINIGMATALPSGNLIVPVIKDADQLNMIGLAKQVNLMANNARNNKLKPEDIQGGTYTVTNVGTFGNVMGTPIIAQPQVAILALGAIRKVPAVIETPEGDFIGIRQKMFLSHSYDHRVVDGALGGTFVKRVADYLEQFDPKREI